MLSLLEPRVGTRDRLSRRELMRLGGVGMLGLSLPMLARARAHSSATEGGLFGRAKNIIYLFLAGGPSQYETFDPKPEAPAEIRGVFQPIATNVPGIEFCELLPRVARVADKLCVVRSFATDNPEHESGGYHVHTGYKYIGPNARSLQPTDWPSMSSIIKMLKPSPTVPFSTAALPEPVMANPNVVLPGHNGGFLGRRWDPQMFACDPSADAFRVEGLAPPAEVPSLRLSARKSLLEQVERHSRLVSESLALHEHDRLTRESLELVLSGAVRSAFDLDRESAGLRDRYGRGKWGQSVLLARRMIEAGVRMVFVNWPREPGDLSANNPLWDTHAQNNPRMKDYLCPQFDLGFTALIEDLDARGLLAETLVVAIGEMGRTPRFNPWGGRDHWGNVFPFVMAGAGISTAQVYGASDRNGAYPTTGRVQPGDLTATIFHLLGISHEATFPDRTGRPLRVTEGEPIFGILGGRPATDLRTEPGGSVPPLVNFSNAPLVNLDFESPAELAPVDKPARAWQAAPIFEASRGDEFSVRLAKAPGRRPRSGERHVEIGFGLATGAGRGTVAPGARALLAQEIHNPRPGQYTFSLHAIGGANEDRDMYRDVWCRHFACRLVIFGFADDRKDPRKTVEFVSQTIVPPWAGAEEADYARYAVSTRLESQNNNANQLGFGVGVAVIVEKSTSGELDLSALGAATQGLIRIDDVALEFTA